MDENLSQEKSTGNAEDFLRVGDEVIGQLIKTIEESNVRDPEDWDAGSSSSDEDDGAPDPPELGEIQWVQCEFTTCQKWRKVPPHIDVEDLPDVFYCRHMQPYDPKHARCDIPEESTSSGEKTTSYSYEVGGINLDTLKVGDWLDAGDYEGILDGGPSNKYP